jgi:RNA methyltransferase, TrmH family
VAAASGTVEVRLVDTAELANLTDTVSPQGVVAVCGHLDTTLAETITSRAQLLVCCADIRDPGNAGTVIRSADAFGADGVLFSPASVDPYNPKTVRATAGSLFHLPLVIEADLATVAVAAREQGLQVLAADGRGEADLIELQTDGTLARPTLWLLGNEAWGLPPTVTALADRVVRVPIWGQAESLNLASAASVCLFATAAAQRARRAG